MNLIIDGIIYKLQHYGGISRTYYEILPRMCELDEELRISLISHNKDIDHLPTHAQIKLLQPWPIEHFIRPYRIWKYHYSQIQNYINRLRLGPTRHKIWHSTYYTTPLAWAGSQVVSVYDLIYEFFAHLFPDSEEVIAQKRQAIQRADQLISNSETTAQDLCEFYNIPKSKIQVAYLASSPIYRIKSASEWKISNAKPFLLYVGSRSKYKNFEDLLNVYALCKYRKQVDLIAVGSPWNQEEIKQISELGIQDNVHLYTYLDNEGLCDLYNQALAFVYTSLYEGFGIPLLEAMACGCPIIASRIPSTIEVAADIPHYFEPGNLDSLLEVLDLVVSEEGLKHNVNLGLKIVSNYSWDKTSQATLEVYRSLT